jgi:uncharacterized protein YggE
LSKNISPIFIIGLLALLGLGVVVAVRWPKTEGLPAAQALLTMPERSLAVVGRGRVSARPDVAWATVGVGTMVSTTQAAIQENRETMQAVLEALEEAGVEEGDIQTIQFSIYTERNGQEGRSEQAPSFHVLNKVRAVIRKLDEVDSTLEQVVRAGASDVDVIFTVEAPASLRAEARDKALADAQAGAEELADLAGVELGQILSLSEVPGPGNSAPGELEIEVQIQVTYAISESLSED